MRRELTLLNSSRRLVGIDERGERVFMDDSARDQKLADLQREIARCP